MQQRKWQRRLYINKRQVYFYIEMKEVNCTLIVGHRKKGCYAIGVLFVMEPKKQIKILIQNKIYSILTS